MYYTYFTLFYFISNFCSIVCRELKFAGWWVTSASTGECLEEGFQTLVNQILDQDDDAALEGREGSATTNEIGSSGRQHIARGFKLTAPSRGLLLDDDEDDDLDSDLRIGGCC